MDNIQVRTVKCIEAISYKKEIKDCRPQQYPGQDLKNWLFTLALELQSAGQYEHNMIILMWKKCCYLVAEGTDNEEDYWYTRSAV